MKNVATGILCSVLCALTACGGGGSSSGSKPKSSSSVAVSSSSVVVSSIATSSTPASSSSEAASSAAPSSTPIVSNSSVAVSSVAPSSAPANSSVAVSSADPSSVPASSVASTASSEASSQAVSSSAASVASSSSSSSTPVALTGVFVDSAVAGIAYETSPSGFTGFTSVTGQYQYAEGDKVVFSIGDLVFPEVTAKGVVTPVDIAAEADPSNAARIQVNIAALLQSLDTDGNTDNGISINYAAAAAVAAAVNFNQPYVDFAALPAVTTLVALSGSTTTTLVSESDATVHLNESLARIKAKSLIGTWYINGYDEIDQTSYNYVLFVLDEHHYVYIDQYGDGSELEVGTYSWDPATGVVTTGIDFETENVLDSYPPMATGNTLEVDGDTLTFTDEDETFVATRLKPTQSNPLIGGWEVSDTAVFAFTDTHYFMGQYTEADEAGNPGVEIGSYEYNTATKEITYSTLLDTNDQWGLSHPCAIQNRDEIINPLFETLNYFACGADGDIVQTFEVTGDTLTFISEADTIAFGEEEPGMFERVNTPLADGDIHLKLEVTLTLTEYVPGARYELENGMATMQCDDPGSEGYNAAEHVPGYTEELSESWVLGGTAERPTWVATIPADYNPVTKELTFDIHEALHAIPGHDGFFSESWEDLDAEYREGEVDVITGTYTEINNLTWDRDDSVSTCTSTYSVVGKLRPVAELSE